MYPSVTPYSWVRNFGRQNVLDFGMLLTKKVGTLYMSLFTPTTPAQHHFFQNKTLIVHEEPDEMSHGRMLRSDLLRAIKLYEVARLTSIPVGQHLTSIDIDCFLF
jgi:hypothetical protein